MNEICFRPGRRLTGFTGLQTFGADLHHAADAIDEEMDALKVREKPALGNAGHFFPDASFFLRHTPSGDDPARNWTFSTEFASFCHNGVSYHIQTIRSSTI